MVVDSEFKMLTGLKRPWQSHAQAIVLVPECKWLPSGSNCRDVHAFAAARRRYCGAASGGGARGGLGAWVGNFARCLWPARLRPELAKIQVNTAYSGRNELYF